MEATITSSIRFALNHALRFTRMAENGVACNVHFKPLPMHTAYKNLGFHIEDFPNAYEMYHNEITLPLHTCLTDEQADYVIDTFCSLVK